MAMMKWLDKIPMELRAVVAGVLVIGAGTVPWAILVSLNLKQLPAVPWSFVVMAIYLWLLARYLNGWGWPRELAEARRRSLRIARPPQPLWHRAMIAGGLAALSLRATADVARRLSPHPGQDLAPPEMLAKYPFATVLLLLLMTAAVAGFAEEAGARGYMQTPLERRYGPVAAIGIVGLIFAMMHFRFDAPDLWPWLLFTPLYLLASVIFGILAWRTNSTLPGMIWHFLFDAVGLLRYWWGGIPKSVWEVGFDSMFKAECALAILAAIPAIWAYRRLVAASVAEAGATA